MASPFLNHCPTAENDSLAILHLRRNLLVPTILKSRDEENEGYDEGKVTNTRYGSFPHSTLIGKPWGSQVIASKVDTGSRGRRNKQDKGAATLKRKIEELEGSEATEENKPTQKEAVAAASGFIHLVRPTPEAWTASLPHRTQVVYTPDYSYILHRLRVRSGSTIIEAGAGSGSFTHASARAVFSGYPSDGPPATKKPRLGKVCSFEFHKQRSEKVREELRSHGLEGIVHVNHRDVYNEGFLLGDPVKGESPKANAVFLDLPAPWSALKHLAREPADGSLSPLDPSSPVHLCAFSPCLEQAEQTIRTLRQHSWISISMVEVAHRQIEVRREKYGVEGDRGIPGPRSVDEAVGKLQTYEERAKSFRDAQLLKPSGGTTTDETDTNDVDMSESADPESSSSSSQAKSSVPIFKQGQLIHRTENELKTHTSYLTFATLPCAWSEEDEQRCRKQWPSRAGLGSEGETKKTKKQLKVEVAERERQLRAERKLDAAAKNQIAGDQ